MFSIQEEPRQQLTTLQLYNVAVRLKTNSEIKRLMLQLKVKDSTVDAIFKKKDDIRMGVYETLKGWRKEQTDPTMVYAKLWCALCDADLYSVAKEVLEYLPIFGEEVCHFIFLW